MRRKKGSEEGIFASLGRGREGRTICRWNQSSRYYQFPLDHSTALFDMRARCRTERTADMAYMKTQEIPCLERDPSLSPFLGRPSGCPGLHRNVKFTSKSRRRIAMRLAYGAHLRLRAREATKPIAGG